MRFYVRMREIEVISADVFAASQPNGQAISTPQIDWSWKNASAYFTGKIRGPLPRPERYIENKSYQMTWLYPHVALPHIISFLIGGALFAIGRTGLLGMAL
jgi:hypothetical protein